MKITLDIAGFYYDTDVDVPEGSTIKDVMTAAKNLGVLPCGAKLDFSDEPFPTINGTARAGNQVDRITITHSNDSAKSRQKSVPRRVYPDGIYSFVDDATIDEVTGKFRSLDPNKHFVHAWQYYLYDTEFRDLARARAGNVYRAIVGYDSPDQQLEEGYTIVWRLVTIMVGPNVHDAALVPSSKMTMTVPAVP
jgi:hypothetical protein